MLSKLEFSDLYKFLTSIGVILMITAFLIPWLYLNQNIDLDLTKEKFVSLIYFSQDLIYSKVAVNQLYIRIIPWLSCSLFIIGFVLFIIGIRKWKIKQNIIDEIESINLAKLRAETKNLKPEEIIEKANENVKEEYNNEKKENEKDDVEVEEEEEEEEEEARKSDSNKENSKEMLLNELSNKLLKIENQVYQKLLDYNSFEYKSEMNVRIGNKYEVDILLTAYNNSKRKDRLIEIIYLQKSLNIDYVRSSYERFRQSFSFYANTTKRNSKYIFVIIIANEIASEDKKERFLTAVKEFEDEVKNIHLEIFCFEDTSLNLFKIEELLN